MDIRGHHLLCMRGFQGKGYSREFVDNFYDVIDKIKKENPTVKVVNRPDTICSACPHNHNGCIKKGPDSEAKVRDKDNKALKSLRIKLDSNITAIKLAQLVNNKISKKAIMTLCGDCEWLEYCIKYSKI